jgi:transcriptional regulator with XRE-family HTH domain
MLPDLARLVTDGRGRLGIDQAELGRRVGVGQQTVSRWERGQGRPKRSVAAALATALDLDVDDVLSAAGYFGATADSAGEASLAVRPLVPGLPFHELAPDRFEDLCVQVIQHLHPEGHASRFGGPGEKQSGIDVLVVLVDGTPLAAAQCKRHRQFGPQDVRRAVADTEIEAPRNYLFLSRQTATAAARSEMAKHPGWELWDGEDIGRHIRTRMAKDEAVRLVDTYFPNHRESFLGVARPGPWETADEFFAPVSGDQQVFTHTWTLVGRSTELADLVQAVRTGEHGIARLVGRGGLGKTRLLRSVAELFDGERWVVRFLPSGATIRPEDFELLPAQGPLLLIIDDGHDRPDIVEVLAQLRRRNPGSKLLIASRPFGEVGLSQDLRRADVLLSELSTVTLADLTQNEAESLARQALGGGHDAIVQRLAHLTLDCPLATVVGGALIRRGLLDPAHLEQDEQIRTQILGGFLDAIVADSMDTNADLRRAVLDGLAALQPFRNADTAFQDALVRLVGTPYHRVQHHLRSLEDAGVLLRRGDSLRLVPDLLGDVVLARACFDERSGTSTGFLTRLAELASGDPLSHVFVNASRVDWQVRQYAAASSPATALWDAFENELTKTDLYGRLAALSLLKRVAYFQPERTLSVVNWILSHPTNEIRPPNEWIARLYPPRWEDVLHDAAPVLQAVAYHLDWTGEACNLLWQLAQTDERPPNQHPDHPVRLLQDLAEFDLSKPMAYNEAILDIASGWFADGQRLSPLQVLEPLLATEGSSHTYSDYTISIRPYLLKPESVLPLRQRVIDLALTEIRSTDVRRAAAAAASIETALRFPTGMFNREVSPGERSAWVPSFVATIQDVGRTLADADLDPVIAVAVMKALHWHSEYAKGETQTAANSALAQLPATTVFELSLLLHDGWGHLVRGRQVSFEEAESQHKQRMDAVVRRVLAENDDPSLTLVLEHRLQVEQEALDPGDGHPGPMVAALVGARPRLAHAIIDRVKAVPDSPLTRVLPVVLGRLGEATPADLVPAAEALLALQSPVITATVAQAFGWSRGPRSSLVEGELDLLRSFAASTDPWIRESAIVAARRIAPEHPQAASDLLSGVSFRDSPRLADRIFALLVDDDCPLRWDLMWETQQAAITEELVAMEEVGEYWLMTFLSQRSATHPREVLDLFRRRMVKAEAIERLGAFDPVPFAWEVPLRVREHSDFLAILRELHQWISESGSRVRHEDGAELFAAAAGGFDAAVLALLKGMLEEGSPASVDGVAAILRKAHREIVYTEVPFVLAALDAAARFGDECERNMSSALWAATVTGPRSGAPGKPFPEDLQQRDECAAIAKTLVRGSRGEKFYTSLSESAEQSIRWDAQREGARNDTRDW